MSTNSGAGGVAAHIAAGNALRDEIGAGLSSASSAAFIGWRTRVKRWFRATAELLKATPLHTEDVYQLQLHLDVLLQGLQEGLRIRAQLARRRL